MGLVASRAPFKPGARCHWRPSGSFSNWTIPAATSARSCPRPGRPPLCSTARSIASTRSRWAGGPRSRSQGPTSTRSRSQSHVPRHRHRRVRRGGAPLRPRGPARVRTNRRRCCEWRRHRRPGTRREVSARVNADAARGIRGGPVGGVDFRAATSSSDTRDAVAKTTTQRRCLVMRSVPPFHRVLARNTPAGPC